MGEAAHIWLPPDLGAFGPRCAPPLRALAKAAASCMAPAAAAARAWAALGGLSALRRPESARRCASGPANAAAAVPGAWEGADASRTCRRLAPKGGPAPSAAAGAAGRTWNADAPKPSRGGACAPRRMAERASARGRVWDEEEGHAADPSVKPNEPPGQAADGPAKATGGAKSDASAADWKGRRPACTADEALWWRALRRRHRSHSAPCR